MKEQLKPLIRQIIVATVTAILILMFLIVATRGQQREEQRVAEETLRANLAIACVLALPVTEQGRRPEQVHNCFLQYDLPAPKTRN